VRLHGFLPNSSNISENAGDMNLTVHLCVILLLKTACCKIWPGAPRLEGSSSGSKGLNFRHEDSDRS